MPPVSDLRTAWQPKGQASNSSKLRAPVAIVDIGSNSVRLVVYEAQNRVAATLQNEKSICGIGRDMVTTGRLHAEGCTAALEALSRFRMIADGLNVEHRDAVATAAARDASNGAESIRRAEADGLAADLGGGSLDMVSVKNGQTGAAYSMPFGPLRLMDQSKGPNGME